MIFRPATSEEVEAIWSVVEDGRASLAGIGIDQWQGLHPIHEDVERDLASGKTRVAVDDDGKILGTLVIQDTGELDYGNVTAGAWLTPASNDPELPTSYTTLHRVAIAADAKRHGVGTFMYQEAIKESKERGFASVRVDTHAGNLPMQGLLLKTGFAPCCDIELESALIPADRWWWSF